MLIDMHVFMDGTKEIFLQMCYLVKFMTVVSRGMKVYDYHPLNYSKRPH